MTPKERFMKISSYQELQKRKEEFKGVKMDRDMLKHASSLFPKATNTTEELYKTPPSKGGTIGR